MRMAPSSGSRITLSADCVLIFILCESGVSGHMTSGFIERGDDERLRVYDELGEPIEYVSGRKLRSWRIFQKGAPLDEWSHVMPEDTERLATEWP
jgi:hypothetical protein